MKSLKIKIIAILSIAILTGVASIDIKPTKEETNKEIKKVQIDLISMTDRKGINIPTQG